MNRHPFVNIAISAVLPFSFSANLRAAQPAVELCDLPLLFADDSGIASRTGVVRTVHVAQRRETPVIEPERPGEGERVYV